MLVISSPATSADFTQQQTQQGTWNTNPLPSASNIGGIYAWRMLSPWPRLDPRASTVSGFRRHWSSSAHIIPISVKAAVPGGPPPLRLLHKPPVVPPVRLVPPLRVKWV